ncbi:MAG TPA: DnaT-like ssDNA-binding protein [Acidobacteriota bacterium]|nr:DnaT-like ssDNA-binding protein [Acidobacteriota bacterium]
MALTVDSSPASASANSFCSRAFADAYHAGRPYSSTSWGGLDDTGKDQRLVAATALLCIHIPWQGAATDPGQPLVFPRTGLTNRNGGAIASNAFPVELQEATAELAFRIGSDDPSLDAARTIRDLGIAQLEVSGAVNLRFWENKTPRSSSIPDEVVAMVRHLAALGRQQTEVATGLTANSSTFSRSLHEPTFDSGNDY